MDDRNKLWEVDGFEARGGRAFSLAGDVGEEPEDSLAPTRGRQGLHQLQHGQLAQGILRT